MSEVKKEKPGEERLNSLALTNGVSGNVRNFTQSNSQTMPDLERSSCYRNKKRFIFCF